jgi:hypothetical protein
MGCGRIGGVKMKTGIGIEMKTGVNFNSFYRNTKGDSLGNCKYSFLRKESQQRYSSMLMKTLATRIALLAIRSKIIGVK